MILRVSVGADAVAVARLVLARRMPVLILGPTGRIWGCTPLEDGWERFDDSKQR